jgi:hypothetical protein
MIAIRDALVDKRVVIAVEIQPGEANTPRDNRGIVLTLGIPNERVKIKTGTFGQLHQLIDVAWSEYGEIVTANQTAVTTEPEEIGSAAPEATVSQSGSYYSDDDF